MRYMGVLKKRNIYIYIYVDIFVVDIMGSL